MARARDEPRRRIQGHEELVGGHVARARELVEQGGLARVGIADEGGHGQPGGLAPFAQESPMGADAVEIAAYLLDPVADHAAIGFELVSPGPRVPMPPPRRSRCFHWPTRRGSR